MDAQNYKNVSQTFFDFHTNFEIREKTCKSKRNCKQIPGNIEDGCEALKKR